MANYKYYLGPLEWGALHGINCWHAPTGTVGFVDLRSVPGQNQAGISFFACNSALISEWTLIGEGDCREIPVTTAMRDAWQSLLGYRPTGDFLVDLLWSQLTTGSDPTGDTPTPPLMPTTSGNLDLIIDGHSIVKRERYQHGKHSHTAKVNAVLQRDFRRQFGQGPDHACKVLDFWCEKYGLSRDPKSKDWRQFVPADLRAHAPGPKKHSTTITESFNTSDSTTLGPDLTWGEAYTNWSVVSNECEITTLAKLGFARAESDLSGSDNYGQVVVTQLTDGSANHQLGPMCRCNSSGTEGYGARVIPFNSPDTFGIFKMDGSGNITAIGSDVNQALSLPDTVKVNANGSTISADFNGSELRSATDTTYTTGVRCGLFGFRGSTGATAPHVDDFEAGDISAGSSVAPLAFNHLQKLSRA